MHTEKTQSTEDAFRTIYESCEEGIIVVTERGTITLANTAAHRIFGYAPGTLPGHSVEELIPKPLQHKHTQYRDAYKKDPKPRRMGAGRDLLGRKQNGEHLPVEISLNTAIIDGQRHVIAYIIDISERKKFETALRKSEEQLLLYASELEKRVKERTEELEKTNMALEQQISVTQKAEKEATKALERERELNELKSRFVSMASHEFRTPLSTILSSTSLIERYQDQPASHEKQKRHLLKIKAAIGNLNGILDDFLSLSRLEEGRLEVDLQPVALRPICQQVIEELTPLLKPGQQINFSTSGEPTPVTGDSKIIKNIIINLMSNAIKYSEEKITMHAAFDEGRLVEVSIVDYGMGIPEEDQKHLFERFFRAKNATNIQGTGLGLNIVKKYIEMLGGDINFKSELNKGTEFKVCLPKHTGA